MNKNLKSSPFGLNNFTLKTSAIEENNVNINFGENIFSNKPENMDDTREEKIVKIKRKEKNIAKKRLNDLDGNILRKFSNSKKEKVNFIQKINMLLKNNKECVAINNFMDNVLFLFPVFTRYKFFRRCTEKLKKINDSASMLVLEKVPFGESQKRYDELSYNISLACKIQAKLRKR